MFIHTWDFLNSLPKLLQSWGIKWTTIIKVPTAVWSHEVIPIYAPFHTLLYNCLWEWINKQYTWLFHHYKDLSFTCKVSYTNSLWQNLQGMALFGHSFSMCCWRNLRWISAPHLFSQKTSSIWHWPRWSYQNKEKKYIYEYNEIKQLHTISRIHNLHFQH